MERQAQKELMSPAKGQQGCEGSQSRLGKRGRKWLLWRCPHGNVALSKGMKRLFDPENLTGWSIAVYTATHPHYFHPPPLLMEYRDDLQYSKKFPTQVLFPSGSYHTLQVGNVPSLFRWNTCEKMRTYTCLRSLGHQKH